MEIEKSAAAALDNSTSERYVVKRKDGTAARRWPPATDQEVTMLLRVFDQVNLTKDVRFIPHSDQYMCMVCGKIEDRDSAGDWWTISRHWIEDQDHKAEITLRRLGG